MQRTKGRSCNSCPFICQPLNKEVSPDFGGNLFFAVGSSQGGDEEYMLSYPCKYAVTASVFSIADYVRRALLPDASEDHARRIRFAFSASASGVNA
jgi:hypothetical protein